MTIRISLLLAVLCLPSLATPARAQWRDPGADDWSDARPAAATTTKDLFSPWRRGAWFNLERPAGAVRPPAMPRGRSALLGAGIGAAVGGAAFLAASGGCWRKVESMCELAIPIYVGAGAVSGGLLGFALGGRRPAGGER